MPTDMNPVSVERQGIKITKMLDTNTFNQGLAVRFTIESTHNQPLNIRVLDQLPENFNINDVGFHPDYYQDRWDIHDNKFAVFNYTIEPDETIDTLYVTAGFDDFDMDEFREEPQIVEATPEKSTDETTNDSREDTNSTDNDVNEDEETDPQDDSSWFGGEEPPENTNEAETSEEKEDTEDNTDSSDDTPDEASPLNARTNSNPSSDEEETELKEDTSTGDTTESSVVGNSHTEPSENSKLQPQSELSQPDSTDSIAETLQSEIETGGLSDETLSVIASAVGEHLETEGAPEARLTHLESRVSELEAYTSALEEFLNESGTANTLADDVANMSESVETLENRLDNLEDSLDDESLDSLEDELAELHDDVETLLTWRNAMTSAIDNPD